jgi:hypothetical protein
VAAGRGTGRAQLPPWRALRRPARCVARHGGAPRALLQRPGARATSCRPPAARPLAGLRLDRQVPGTPGARARGCVILGQTGSKTKAWAAGISAPGHNNNLAQGAPQHNPPDLVELGARVLALIIHVAAAPGGAGAHAAARVPDGADAEHVAHCRGRAGRARGWAGARRGRRCLCGPTRRVGAPVPPPLPTAC